MSDADRLDEILGDWLERRSQGEFLAPRDVVAAHPELEVPLRARFAALEALDEMVALPPPSEAHSVIANLSDDANALRPVLLRDLDTDEMPAPLVRAGTAESGVAGRYSVLGEIARGGVGVVLKGHDVDLGRDVAMKVLLERHQGNADILQRFVEEAQIGGQLQHPGIVPVYEMGLSHDRRPYFTMKLVKGKTLSELLQYRSGASEERHRFLSIFESICQTVGYAHVRGVIHRDLKPANVMVGAFGEVLVVDWGMGKVLRRGGVADEKAARTTELSVVQTLRSESEGSASRVGSIMGTLRYMPPEQARGELECIDERSDVFSLGAILCEILTGSPPYTGEAQHDVLQQAAGARLDHAYERLAQSGADQQLITITRSCLVPAQDARPKNAAAVAEWIGQYLSDVEERAHRAEVNAAKARARVAEEEARAEKESASAAAERAAAERERSRAEHERAQAELARKAGHRTRLLAASLIALIVLAGGSWLWIDRERQQRELAATRLVTEALEEANAFRGRAELSDDPAVWRQAVVAARRATAIAEREDVDSATVALAQARAEELTIGSQAAARRAAQRAEDQTLIRKLDKISAIVDLRQHGDEYVAVFRAHDLDVLAMEPDVAAEALRASAIHADLVLRLHGWLDAELICENYERIMRGEIGVGDRPGERAQHLIRVLGLADDNEWRRRMCNATRPETLRTLAAEADLDHESPLILFALASKLGRTGLDEEAAALGARIVERRPGDFWANFQSANWAKRRHRPADALPFARAALALRPQSPAAHSMIGQVLGALGNLEDAERHDRERLRLDPENPSAHGDLGVVLWRKRDFDGAVAATRAGLERASRVWTRALLLTNLGTQLAAQGEEPEAEEAYQEALRLYAEDDPNGSLALGGLASLYYQQGKLVEVTEHSERAIRLSPDALYQARLYALLALVLERQGDLAGVVAAYRESLKLDPSRADRRTNLAANLWKVGKRTEAQAQAQEALRQSPDYPNAHLLWGAMLQAEGDRRGAMRALRRAIALQPDQQVAASAHASLADLLVAQADYDEAIASYRKAAELGPDSPQPWFCIGWTALKRDPEMAQSALEHALKLDPDHAGAWCLLGLVRWGQRRLQPALEALRKGHELGKSVPGWSLSSDSWLADLERSVALQDRLAQVEGGEVTPQDPQERIWYARAANSGGRFVLAATLFQQAFQEDPALAGDPHPSDAQPYRRIWAASAAVRAASVLETGSREAGTEARIWRTRALAWLRAELEHGGRALDSDPVQYARALDSWIHDSDLASVRDSDGLASLTEEERESWGAFWRDVRSLLDRSRAAARKR